MPRSNEPIGEWEASGGQRGLPTIPTVAWEDENGDTHTAPKTRELRAAYAAVERAMFADPDQRAKRAEILQHIRSQQRDDTYGGDQERMNGKRVIVLSPEYVELLGNPDATFGDPHTKKRDKTAREQWEDELVSAGLRPILDELTIAQRDAVRLVYFEGMTQREAAAVLKVDVAAVNRALKRAYGNIAKALPMGGYRAVRKHLEAKGREVGVDYVSKSDTDPTAQRPIISEKEAMALRQLDAFRAQQKHHRCDRMCDKPSHSTAGRQSGVRHIALDRASVRFDPKRANAVRLAYEVPDRQVPPAADART